MDHANELSKTLHKTGKGTEGVLHRDFRDHHLVDRIRDVLDSGVPVEFSFNVPDLPDHASSNVLLDLRFYHVAPAQGCAGCFCGKCNVFIGPNETTLQLSHDFVAGTIRVFLNGLRILNFTPSGTNEIILGFSATSTDVIKVCYLASIC